jgi:hypothetical protein
MVHWGDYTLFPSETRAILVPMPNGIGRGQNVINSDYKGEPTVSLQVVGTCIEHYH